MSDAKTADEWKIHWIARARDAIRDPHDRHLVNYVADWTRRAAYAEAQGCAVKDCTNTDNVTAVDAWIQGPEGHIEVRLLLCSPDHIRWFNLAQNGTWEKARFLG